MVVEEVRTPTLKTGQGENNHNLMYSQGESKEWEIFYTIFLLKKTFFF